MMKLNTDSYDEMSAQVKAFMADTDNNFVFMCLDNKGQWAIRTSLDVGDIQDFVQTIMNEFTKKSAERN